MPVIGRPMPPSVACAGTASAIEDPYRTRHNCLHAFHVDLFACLPKIMSGPANTLNTDSTRHE